MARSLPFRLAGLALLSWAAGCTAPASSPATLPTGLSRPDPPPLRGEGTADPVQPGDAAPGSRVVLPRRMRAGEELWARVPPGSVVEGFGRRMVAGADGRVRLRAPSSPGTYAVTVLRAGHAAPLRVLVTVPETAGD